MSRLDGHITTLRRTRPRSLFLRFSLALAAIVVAGSWMFGGFFEGELLSARRMQNLQRFVEQATPQPLRAEGGSWPALAQWLGRIMNDRGWTALLDTLAISIAAIVLAGLFGLAASLPAARTIATHEPYLRSPSEGSPRARIGWMLLVAGARTVLIFARSIPEYVWAFLLLALLGPSSWPAVLALAIHNTGILGKLGAEVLENIEPQAPGALRAAGASRLQLTLFGLLPITLPRHLLFFFYRWETCVREATILGLLGVTSLGYWIQDARARDQYDDMLLFIMLGAALVCIGDLVSVITRKAVRHAG